MIHHERCNAYWRVDGTCTCEEAHAWMASLSGAELLKWLELVSRLPGYVSPDWKAAGYGDD